MMDGNALLGKLSLFENNKQLLKRYQTTGDIIHALQDAHKRNANDYDKIAQQFWTGNIKTTCKKLFDFCKKNIAYTIEPDESQSIKTPGAILATKKGDCKHYASFINGCLSAIARKTGTPIHNYFRYSAYRFGATEPQHVFAVVKQNNGNEIWIDPVLEQFDEKKTFTFAKDKKAMALYQISGVEAGIGRGGRGRKKLKKFFHNIEKGVEKTGKKIKKGALRIAAAPMRNAFLILLKVNALQLAMKLGKLWNKPNGKRKIVGLWEDKFGGKESALKNAINAGIRHYRFRHHAANVHTISGIDTELENSTIGFLDPASQSLIAAATPIILAVVKLLKGEGVEDVGSEAQQEPAMNEDESQNVLQVVDESINGVIGAVNFKKMLHRKRTHKPLKVSRPALVQEMKRTRKSATEIMNELVKAKRQNKLTPAQKTFFQKTQDILFANKGTTDRSITDAQKARKDALFASITPTSVYDRPGATTFITDAQKARKDALFASITPTSVYDRPGATPGSTSFTNPLINPQTGLPYFSNTPAPTFQAATTENEDGTTDVEMKPTPEGEQQLENAGGDGGGNGKVILIGAALLGGALFLTSKHK